MHDNGKVDSDGRQEESPIRVRLLGPITLFTEDGVEIGLSGKAMPMLVHLATDPSTKVRRAELLSTAYPDEVPSPAAADAMLSRFRKVLNDAGGLLVEGSHPGGERWFQLDLDRLAIDAFRLEDLLDAARSCGDDATEAAVLLRRGVLLFLPEGDDEARHPEPLGGLTGYVWSGEADRYRGWMVDAELALARIETATDAAAAESRLQRLTRVAPHREDVWEALVVVVRQRRGPREARNLANEARRTLVRVGNPATPLVDRLRAQLRNEDAYRPSAGDGNPLILIVDDQDGPAMKRQLSDLDCHIVDSLEAALDYIANPTNCIDLVLVDMDLGQPRDGEQVLEAIQRHRVPLPPPVAVVSQYPVSPGARRFTYELDAEFMERFGVYEILSKSGPGQSVNHLRRTVEAMLQQDGDRALPRIRSQIDLLVDRALREVRRNKHLAEHALRSANDPSEEAQHESAITDFEAIEDRVLELQREAQAEIDPEGTIVEEARIAYSDLVASLRGLGLLDPA